MIHPQMNFVPVFMAASDGSGVIVLIIIIIVVAAIIKATSKPKGKWVYVEQKKGCVLMLLLLVLGALGGLGTLIARLVP
jgi:hypothetical protein